MRGSDDEHNRRPRRAARTILLDRRERVLLFRGRDPARPEAGTWWFTPGGEVNHGETIEDAARRELHEETGLLVDSVGPVICSRTVDLEFDGSAYRQHEVYFLVRVEHFDVDDAGWTDTERRALLEHRWWSAGELRATAETVYPQNLVTLLHDHAMIEQPARRPVR